MWCRRRRRRRCAMTDGWTLVYSFAYMFAMRKIRQAQGAYFWFQVFASFFHSGSCILVGSSRIPNRFHDGRWRTDIKCTDKDTSGNFVFSKTFDWSLLVFLFYGMNMNDSYDSCEPPIHSFQEFNFSVFCACVRLISAKMFVHKIQRNGCICTKGTMHTKQNKTWSECRGTDAKMRPIYLICK